jgi:hypothetical protein
MLIFIRMAKFTEATIISIVNIPTGLDQAMAGRQAMALQAKSAGELAELAISATNSEQNVMGKLRVLIALVSVRLRIVAGC